MKWTHKGIKIIDLRKLRHLYMLKLDVPEIKDPILLSSEIFEERINSYFLKDIKFIPRENILNLKWNMYLNKGYFIKVDNGNIEEFPKNRDKWYISYLDVQSPLGNLENVFSKPNKN